MVMRRILAFFVLAAALFSSWAQEKAKPLEQVEVIPGDFSIKSYSHRIEIGDKRLDCFTYVSEGLEQHGQHEVVLTLPRKGIGKGVPPDIVEIFKAIHARAESGPLVDAYDGFALDPGTSFLGRTGDWGFFFVPAEVLDGVEVPFEALAATLVKGDEVALLKKHLSYRLASVLGAAYRYYPCPCWSDPARKPMVSAKDAEKSLAARADWRFAPGLSVRMSHAEGENREIVLTVELKGLPKLNSVFANPPHPDSPEFDLLTFPDPLATMRLAWMPGSNKTGVIFAVPSTSMTGGFLLLRGGKGVEERARSVEDGFELCLNAESWNRLTASMSIAVPVAFPIGGKGLTVRTEFLRRFPFDELVELPYHVAGVSDCQAYMMLRARVPDVGSVEDYIKALNKAASTALKDSKPCDARGVLIAVGVKPGKKVRVWCEAVEGSLPEEMLKSLGSALEAVPTVEVKDGPIAFAIRGVLWNRKVKEFPDRPTVWSKALAESGKYLTVPDGLFALIWPD